MANKDKDQRFASQSLGIAMFVIVTGLLLTPGSIYPKAAWLNKIALDKIVHFVLFGLLTLVWCHYYFKGTNRSATKRTFYLHLLIIFSVYAVCIEYVQGTYPKLGRSFDLRDIIAGVAGNIAAYFYAYFNFVRKKDD
jgi:VanZ family protein